MKLYCLDDTSKHARWGRSMASAAKSRGIDAVLFTDADSVPDDAVVFMPVAQWPPDFQRDQRTALRLFHRGVRMFPRYPQIAEYESKWEQALRHHKLMPKTLLIEDFGVALASLEVLGYPFVSKASVGSGSANVRLIKSTKEAVEEADRVFGTGLPIRRGGEALQRGYLIWQQFLPGNSGDYRVIRIGSQYLMMQRHNRPHVPFASGSGNSHSVTFPMSAEQASVLEAAIEMCEQMDAPWVGIDLVRDPADRTWKLIETTVRWTIPAYNRCEFFPRLRKYGRDIWDVALDELEKGLL